MHYEEFPPPASLGTIVDRLWVLETTARDTAVDPILPDGHPEIIVHLGPPFSAIGRNGRRVVQAPVLFAGQLTRAVRIAPRGATRVIGARLHPHAPAAFVRASQHELADQVVDLGTLHPALARALRRRRPGPSRAADLERVAAVLRAAADPGAMDAALGRAITLALTTRGLVRVEHLAREAGVGPSSSRTRRTTFPSASSIRGTATVR